MSTFDFRNSQPNPYGSFVGPIAPNAPAPLAQAEGFARQNGLISYVSYSPAGKAEPSYFAPTVAPGAPVIAPKAEAGKAGGSNLVIAGVIVAGLALFLAVR